MTDTQFITTLNEFGSRGANPIYRRWYPIRRHLRRWLHFPLTLFGSAYEISSHADLQTSMFYKTLRPYGYPACDSRDAL